VWHVLAYLIGLSMTSIEGQRVKDWVKLSFLNFCQMLQSTQENFFTICRLTATMSASREMIGSLPFLRFADSGDPELSGTFVLVKFSFSMILGSSTICFDSKIDLITLSFSSLISTPWNILRPCLSPRLCFLIWSRTWASNCAHGNSTEAIQQGIKQILARTYWCDFLFVLN